jgi:hemerythrin superfamily protein
MLKEDHARVQSLFDDLEKAETDREMRQLASAICSELTLHSQVEEEIFYPEVRTAIATPRLVDEAEVEHGSVRELIAKVETSDPSDDHFAALVKVLAEYVKHHVKQEEGRIFREIRRSELDLAALGERMREYKSAAGVTVEVEAG